MNLGQIYQRIIDLGKEYDPRSQEEINKSLSRIENKYQELKEEEREYFDQESRTNPYSDTRILYGNPEKEVQKVLAGIDIETQEVLLAERLREKGAQIDLLLTHHPEGKALLGLYQVMHMQEDLLAKIGVPINVAEGILTSRISEVQRGLMPLNFNRAVDAARLLDFPFLCAHTPADNMVQDFLTKIFEEKKPDTVGEVISILKEIPEYQEASKMGAGPKVVVGTEKKRAGKIMVDMTGGTGGSEDAYSKLAAAGVGTIIGMHMGENHRKEAEKNHINVVIAGHMSSDSLGMNLLLDELEKEGLDIKTCSGLIRVKRI